MENRKSCIILSSNVGVKENLKYYNKLTKPKTLFVRRYSSRISMQFEWLKLSLVCYCSDTSSIRYAPETFTGRVKKDSYS